MTLLIPVAAVMAFVLTRLIRKNALANNQLDYPNERSSHTQPTPRGAGMAVATVFSCGLTVLWLANKTSDKNFFTLLLPGLIAALIGRLDDIGKLTSAKWRLLGHFGLALTAVWLAGGLPPLPIASQNLEFGIVGDALAIVYLVWMLNLFNFMDGIDLITAIETITICIATALLLIMKTDSTIWLILAVLGASVLGFAFLNLPPAKIFLGDVGSGFIGLTLAVISIIVAKDEPLIAWAFVIMFGVFVADSTVALGRRIVGKETVYVAHRTHAYQRLAVKMQNHLPVSIGVAAINLLWLLPISWLVVDKQILPIVGLLIAYVPLVVTALILQSGKPLAT